MVEEPRTGFGRVAAIQAALVVGSEGGRQLVETTVDWLNRILAVARGQREARAVRLEVYEVE